MFVKKFYSDGTPTTDVEDLLLPLETAIGHFESGLMEGLRLVQCVAIRSPELVSVQILLGLPGVTVPKLTVALITASQSVGALGDLELG